MPNTSNANPINRVVLTRLNKLFASYVEGSEGWIYAAQAEYKPLDIFHRLFQAVAENSSVEDVCTDFSGCSPDVVQDRINPLEFEQTVHQINQCLQDVASSFLFHGNQIITLAIDITDKEFYGNKEHELSKGSKPKNGTCYFNRYFTASLISPKFRVPVYFRPLRKQDSASPEVLFQEMWNLLRSWLPVERILGDGYFYSQEVIESCDFYGFDYLLNMTEYPWVKEKIAQIRQMLERMAHAVGVDPTNIRAFWYWLGRQGLRTWKFPNQAVEPSSRPSEIVLRLKLQTKKTKPGAVHEKLVFFSYVTNIQASGTYLETLYGSKWGIETGYRVQNQFRAYTTSQSTSMRIWLMGLGFVVMALWLFLNLRLNRFHEQLTPNEFFREPFRVYRTDQLVLIVKKFLRQLQDLWRYPEVI